MEKNFIEQMESDEELLFHGNANISKASKQIGRFILGFIVVALFWYLFINSVKINNYYDFKLVIILITLIILTIALLYGLIYNVLLKNRIRNNEYFVSNKRIGIYSIKRGLRVEKCSNIEHIGVVREKGIYGDIIFSFYASNLFKQIKIGFSFEGIENPRKILQMIININPNIHVYDDRTTIMRRKI